MNSSLDTRHIGALDIGGTKIAASVADSSGPLARVMQPTVKTGSARSLPEQAIALLDAACRQAGIATAQLQAIGVSSCGPFVRIGDAIALTTPNICGGGKAGGDLPNDWEAIPLEAVLRERFDCVAIDIDCIAALTAERLFGAAQEELDCVYVTWSTGIGFGICSDGRILRGKHGNAGHAGHMLMSEQADALCGCGNRGDLEALISGRNIGGRAGQTAPELFAAARNGDAAALELTGEAARWLGRALYNLTVTLDTRVFVIGGSVWQHHGDWLAPLVTKEIAGRFPALTAGVRLVPAELADWVADFGAFSLVMPSGWVEHWRRTRPWHSADARLPLAPASR